MRELVRELNLLSSIDFEPAARAQFFRVRGNLAYIADQSRGSAMNLVEPQFKPLFELLNHYRGAGSGCVKRAFAFIADPKLKELIERDYQDLVIRVFPSGAWKSTVILCGSILEAVLHDRLILAKWNTGLVSWSKYPKDPITKKQLSLDEWNLESLINGSRLVKPLPEDRTQTVYQVLRDFRNFVHPKKEIRSKYARGEPEAMMSVGALDGICNHIEGNP